MTTNGFFPEMLSFFQKILISNVGRDSIPAVDNVYDDDDDVHS